MGLLYDPNNTLRRGLLISRRTTPRVRAMTRRELRCDTPSTESPSTPSNEWLADKWWAEKIRLSRPENMTPSQRRERARALKLLRKARRGEDGWILLT